MNLPIPKFVAEQISTIDSICATLALGTLHKSPNLFLRHEFDLQPPNFRSTTKILNTIAIVVVKPSPHPLYHLYSHDG